MSVYLSQILRIFFSEMGKKLLTAGDDIGPIFEILDSPILDRNF